MSKSEEIQINPRQLSTITVNEETQLNGVFINVEDYSTLFYKINSLIELCKGALNSKIDNNYEVSDFDILNTLEIVTDLLPKEEQYLLDDLLKHK
ncbi:hypothetical protein [Faecalibacter sp. LW9]|uniref:hypothetical protein n=1 Tax=Faecalibacter sp. LW9 TaxID=3103144 RepID=UPI002AFF3CD0|nr:hypothetical protein [Faecalibacter sp. LW9]